MSKNILKFLILFCLGLTVTTSCGEDDSNIEFGGGGNTDGGGTDNPDDPTPSNSIEARMECPEVLSDGSTQLISHSTTESGKEVMTYCLEFDKSKLHSRWVAFRFDGATRGKVANRSNDFQDDPGLSSTYQIGSYGFGSGYDRGHLCASADRLYSQKANDNTFYMTNMSPQVSNFNQKYWVTLEGHVQTLGRKVSFADTLYVVKGGTVLDNQIRGYISRSGGKRVAIPKYYFMALLKVKNGVYSSIAFYMEHKSYGSSMASLSDFADNNQIVSVNQLEEQTGINFFPNLPNSIEESVEDQFIPANWSL